MFKGPADPFAALRRATSSRIAYVSGALDDFQFGLWNEEAMLVANAVERRVRQFAAGRNAARAALASLGVSPQPILRGEKGEPIWPAGIVGSISHTADFAAAAVAFRSDFASIGVDVELADDLPDGVLASIATAAEVRRFEDHTGGLKPLLGRLTFSAKEAVYKCVWPLAREFFDFLDVEIVFDEPLTRFTAMPRRCFAGAARLEEASGWLALTDSHLAAVYLMPAERESNPWH